MLTLSGTWEENNKVFYAAIEKENDFIMNVLLKLYARRGLPFGALDQMRLEHPKESDRQLRARYLCHYKLEPGSVTDKCSGNWYRTEDMMDAAAAAVGIEEGMESVTPPALPLRAPPPFVEEILSVKVLRRIVIQNMAQAAHSAQQQAQQAAGSLDLETSMLANLQADHQDTSQDIKRMIKERRAREEESAAFVDAMIERAQRARQEKEFQAEQAERAAAERAREQAERAAAERAREKAERAAAERVREQAERAAAAKKKVEAKKLKKLREEEEDALLEAECAKAQAAAQELKDRAAAEQLFQDLVNPRPFMAAKQDFAKLPLKMALLTFVLCCSMRNHLFLNALARFSAWTTAALLPPYEIFVHLFTATPKDAPTSYHNSREKTSAAQLVVQVMRNMVSVLELDSILSSDEASGADYQLLYGLLYRSCERREGSLYLLSAMTTLGASKELLDLYEAVSMLENFVSGADFVMFRQAFPLPALPEAPEWIPSRSEANPMDEILSVGLLPHDTKTFMIKTPSPAWSKYFLACKMPLNLTRSLWTANKKQINKWSCGIEALPTAEELGDNGGFKELLPLWFGTTYQRHPLFPNIKMHDTWKLIEACGMSMGVEDSKKSQPLMYLTFLLCAPEAPPNRSALQDFADTCPAFPHTDFPFSKTIFEVRASFFCLPLGFSLNSLPLSFLLALGPAVQVQVSRA